MQYILLIIGIVLIVSAVIQIFLQHDKANAAMLLLPGVLLCMIGVPGVDTFGFNLVGISGTFKKQLDQVATDTKLDIKQEDTGPIKLEIQKLKDALAKQEAFNKQILPIINKLEASAPNSSSAISQPNINSTTSNFAANNQYSIFVFYREARAADSKALVSGLIAAGFQTSGIMTTLEEAQIGPQPDGSTFIIPTDKGKTIGDAVQQIVRQDLPPPRNGAVTLGGPSPLARGDIQVLLY
jgi:hypothetical protein